MALLALKISVDAFEKRLAELDSKLATLNRIRDDYQSLINRMRDNITAEDSDAYQKLEERARYQITALEANINMASATRGALAKVVSDAKENGTLINGILDDSVGTIKNTVGAAADAAKVAAAAAQVAAIL